MRPWVWAPTADRVELVENGRTHVMAREADRFVSDVDLGHGSRYGFRIDGGQDVLPDPRSAHQPDGVHGPSAVVDHSLFEWTAEWDGRRLADSVIYELHVGTFTDEGTFDAAISKFDHLVELGVDFVELMPVAEFPGDRGWGYDGVDLYAPHHAYGGPDGLKRFVDAAHTRGVAVILDVVYNHFGPDGNYLPSFGPYFTSQYATPWGDAVNYDQEDSDEVRAFVLDNVSMWLRDYRIDGLRLDAVHAILDSSAKSVLEEITETASDIASVDGRPRTVVAETNVNDARLMHAGDSGGLGLDGIWSDDLHHALHTRLTGERDGYYGDFVDRDDLVKVINDVFVYDGRYSPTRRRRHGRRVGDEARSCFVVCMQNHDQVGNRARGDRITQTIGLLRHKIGAAIYVLAPFTPMIFAGEEMATGSPFTYFTDHNQELGALVSKGRKAEFAAFGWDEDEIPDPQDRATFEAAKLDWTSADPEMIEWYRQLIVQRRAIGDATARAYNEGDLFVMQRGRLQVVANLGTSRSTHTHEGRVVLSAGRVDEGNGELSIEGDGVAIIVAG